MTNNNFFSIPRRQSGLALIFYLFRNLARFITAILAYVAYSAVTENVRGFIFFIVLGGFAIAALGAFLSYYFFTFHVTEDELVINKGLINRERRHIPFERIQSIQIHRNLVQQILGLSGVKVETAGSGGSELEIPALDARRAGELRELLRYRKKLAQEGLPQEDFENIPEVTRVEEEVRIPLISLSIADLLKVGITENHLKSGLVAVAVIWGYFWQYSNYLEEYIDVVVERYVPTLIQVGIAFFGVVSTLFVVVSIIISMVRVTLQYFNFRASLKDDQVEITTGLLKRNEYRIPLPKIQFISWHSNPLRRILNFETARIHQTQSAKESKKQKIGIPFCKSRETDLLMEHIFDHLEETDFSRLNANKWSYTLLNLYIFLLPLAGISIGLWYWQEINPFLVFLLLFGFQALNAYQNGIRHRIETDGKLLVLYSGWIFPKRTVIPVNKVQAMAVNQSIFLRRRKLVHLEVRTASGNRQVRFLNQDKASELYDYVVAKVEMNKSTWM